MKLLNQFLGALSRPTMRFRIVDAFWLTAVIILQLYFAKFTFLKVLPLVSGWFLQWGKISQIQNPYSDFFFPFPPLGLYILGILPWQFEDQLLAEQIIALVIWAAISCVLFLLLRLVFSSFTSFISATISLTCYLVFPTNITAGFLELAWLFALSSVYFLALSQLKSLPLISVSGALMAASALVKQTFLLPAFLLVIVIVFQGIQSKETIRKTFKNVCFWSIGFGFTTLIAFIPMLIEGSSREAIIQIFSGGGKNPGGSPILTWGIGQLVPNVPTWPIFMLIILVLILNSKLAESVLSSNATILVFGFSISAMLGYYAFTTGNSSNNYLDLISIAPLIISFVGMAVNFKIERNFEGTIVQRRINGLTILATFLILFLAIRQTSTLNQDDFSELSLQGNQLINVLVYAGVLGVFVLMYSSIQPAFRKPQRSHQTFIFRTLFAVSLGVAIVNLLSGGGGIPTYFVPLAMVLGYLFGSLEVRLSSTVNILMGALTVTPALLLLLATQIVTPYDWFGMQVSPLYAEKSVSTIPSLKSFDLSQESVQDFQFIYDSITSDHSDISNSDLNGKILFGPNISGLTSSVFELNPYPLKCPIIWWDVCTEQNFADDFRSIQSDPPQVIVWNFAPESVIQGHEFAFRGGKPSSIRALQKWITEQSTDGCYQEIGSKPIGVGVSTPEAWVAKIYKYVC